MGYPLCFVNIIALKIIVALWNSKVVIDKKCVNTQKLSSAFCRQDVLKVDGMPTHTIPNGIIMTNVYDYLLS